MLHNCTVKWSRIGNIISLFVQSAEDRGYAIHNIQQTRESVFYLVETIDHTIGMRHFSPGNAGKRLR